MRLFISSWWVRTPDVDEFFLVIGGLFLIFIELTKAAFCRALASVCEAKLCLCVQFS